MNLSLGGEDVLCKKSSNRERAFDVIILLHNIIPPSCEAKERYCDYVQCTNFRKTTRKWLILAV